MDQIHVKTKVSQSEKRQAAVMGLDHLLGLAEMRAIAMLPRGPKVAASKPATRSTAQQLQANSKHPVAISRRSRAGQSTLFKGWKRGPKRSLLGLAGLYTTAINSAALPEEYAELMRETYQQAMLSEQANKATALRNSAAMAATDAAAARPSTNSESSALISMRPGGLGLAGLDGFFTDAQPAVSVEQSMSQVAGEINIDMEEL